MEVTEVVPIIHNGKQLTVTMTEVEVRMVLTFGLNELLSRGSISLISPEDRDQLSKLEDLLESDVGGNA